ncbi:LysR family transcriptional regulator [Stenotrophomonas sp. 24(2023)]|uniref:LysR family transcriptional regulator n=1 Tax=Stenotrophomonas sp. 24(2023) TaxID=3068324 RepID=UPI0027E13DD7|nr:LysR family transcriptional regulator [Stenotrophomonas sp. 24(2023)]WMJ71340.1 LysR family transcriptional regulator [Stenotrophomonas sp. 24(2023)]
MDFNDARLFVAVAQAGSLSAAAQRLGLPLPTLSRRMRQLERDLQVQLLERSARGIALTDAGASLHAQLQPGVESLLQAEQALRNRQEQPSGRLRLSLPQTFWPWWDLLDAFQQRYPQVEVYVLATERRVDLVEDGIDVALRVGPLLHEDVIALPLMQFRNVLVASPALIARLGAPASPQALLDYPCAVWATRVDSRAQWQLGTQQVRPRPVLAVNDYHQLCERALAGHAVTELPPFLAAPHLRSGRLVPLLPAHPLPTWALHLVHPPRRPPSTLVRTYLAFCQQHIGQVQQACALP